jgi:AcrR family transcriptional regulator
MSPRISDPNARVKLLAAAETVFVAEGLDRAKVEQITARAGMSKGAFYLHFDSKEDAFRELIENMLARLATFLDSCSMECSADDLGVYVDFWVNNDLMVFEFIWQNRGLCGLLLGGGSSAAYRHLVDAFADGAAVKVRERLQRGIDAGIFRRNLDLGVTSNFISGAYDRLARQILASARKPDLVAMLTAVQFLVLRSIGTTELARRLDRLAAASARAGEHQISSPVSPANRRQMGRPRVRSRPRTKATA